MSGYPKIYNFPKSINDEWLRDKYQRAITHKTVVL